MCTKHGKDKIETMDRTDRKKMDLTPLLAFISCDTYCKQNIA
jgi:hypothetical protein